MARRPGGAHENAKRWTGPEDSELKRILNETSKQKKSWEKIAHSLVAQGYEKRTAKSVRNRWLRINLKHSVNKGQPKNYCRVCGEIQRGHVCVGTVSAT